MVERVVEVARRIAEEVLLPDAAAVDAGDRIPEAHLAALDAAGLTGLAAEGPTLAERVDVTAALAGGCLATAFVWLQHQGALGPVAAADGPVADLAPEIAAGRLRAGVVVTAVHGSDPLRLSGRPGALRLRGSARWVSAWGLAQVFRVAALDADGSVVTALVDVDPGMRAEPARLVAADASGTVTLAFEDVPVQEGRCIERVSPEAWAAADAAGLAGNGALALGVAGRAAAELGSDALASEVAEARRTLLAADVAGLPAARAACSALAVRAASALAVHDGGGGVLRGSRSDRLLREAHLLLGFGSRPAIRAALLDRLGA